MTNDEIMQNIEIIFRFSSNLKNFRKAKNLTQGELSELLNIKRCALGAYEEERAFPTIPTLCNISRTLKVPIDKLLLGHVIWSERD